LITILAKWPGLLAVESVLAAVVFAVVAGLVWMLRRRGPALHVALWSLVFIRLVLPPGLAHPLGAGNLVDALVESRLGARAHSFDHAGAGSAGAACPVAVPTETKTSAPAASSPLFGALWFLGFAVVSAAYLRRIGAVRRLVSASNPVADARVVRMGESWRRRLGVKRRVRIVTSDTGTAPFTMGVFRPIIYLPMELMDDIRSVEAAVAHEMGHVARFDALWLRLQQIVQAIYFFNPIVWISGARLIESRERLCDETVMAAGGFAARDYVGGLITVLRLDLRGAGAPTMSARTRRIGARISNILDSRPRHPRVGFSVALCCVIGVFILPMGTAGSSAPPEVENQVEQVPVPINTAEAVELKNPVAGSRVTRGWGPGRDPFSKNGVFHKGIDLAAGTGTPVHAPADGVVETATEAYEPLPAAGTVVILSHGDGLQTFYSHLGTLEVSVGQKVAQGDVIATVGSTGKSTGPHVHFEVRVNGERKDPALFVEDWN
jgi:murein DD-endopeptidase MepM/ murein hydrolase activator NlpD